MANRMPKPRQNPPGLPPPTKPPLYRYLRSCGLVSSAFLALYYGLSALFPQLRDIGAVSMLVILIMLNLLTWTAQDIVNHG